MKRTVLVIVAVCFSFGLNVALLAPRACEEAALAGPASGNGDVNADGKIDIADAIHLLGYLFARGPAPEAIECAACDSWCPPPGGGALPATGQATCYGYDGQGWAETPGDGAGDSGQDGFYQAGCPSAERFTDNGDDTVTDNCTGLMWQKKTAPRDYSWRQALRYCERLELGGYADWRLPNVRELQSIADYGRYDASIDPLFAAESDWYWSSSSHIDDPDYAWFVDFEEGYVDYDDKDEAYYVRAVRGGP